MDDFVGGGLGGGSTEPAEYFYLVYDSSGNSLSSAHKSAYFKLGVTTNDEWVFILVDDHTDNRLRGALETSDEGRAFYEKIRAAIPCFIFSDGRLKANTRLTNAAVHPITDFDKSVNLIYERMGVHPPSVRKKALDFFRGVNEVIKLSPSAFGVGVNINAFISMMIDRIDVDKRLTPLN